MSFGYTSVNISFPHLLPTYVLDSFQLLSVLILSVFYCPLSLKTYAPEVRDYDSTLLLSKEYSIMLFFK